MVKSSHILIFISFIVFMLPSCQTQVAEEVLNTELELTVTDVNGKPLSGAVVALFNDDALYLQKSPFYSTEGAVKVDTTANGVCVLSGLNSKDNYRISVHYKDYSTYQGGYIDWDNNGQNYNVLNNLVNGSHTLATIKLKPANGLVTFWTGTDNMQKLPLQINITNTLIDSVIQTSASQPHPFDPGITTIRLKKGRYSYYAKSKTGCVFSDSLIVDGGSFQYVKIGSCNTGRLSFWTAQANNSSLPVTVILGNNDTLGIINSVYTSAPQDCYDAGLLFADREPGSYSYTAISNTSKLIWTGKITLVKDDCQLIEIK